MRATHWAGAKSQLIRCVLVGLCPHAASFVRLSAVYILCCHFPEAPALSRCAKLMYNDWADAALMASIIWPSVPHFTGTRDVLAASECSSCDRTDNALQVNLHPYFWFPAAAAAAHVPARNANMPIRRISGTPHLVRRVCVCVLCWMRP